MCVIQDLRCFHTPGISQVYIGTVAGGHRVVMTSLECSLDAMFRSGLASGASLHSYIAQHSISREEQIDLVQIRMTLKGFLPVH